MAPTGRRAPQADKGANVRHRQPVAQGRSGIVNCAAGAAREHMMDGQSRTDRASWTGKRVDGLSNWCQPQSSRDQHHPGAFRRAGIEGHRLLAACGHRRAFDQTICKICRARAKSTQRLRDLLRTVEHDLLRAQKCIECLPDLLTRQVGAGTEDPNQLGERDRRPKTGILAVNDSMSLDAFSACLASSCMTRRTRMAGRVRRPRPGSRAASRTPGLRGPSELTRLSGTRMPPALQSPPPYRHQICSTD